MTPEISPKFPLEIPTNRDESPDVLASLEALLLARRGWITRAPIAEDVVLIYSGGLDSTVSIDMLMQEWKIERLFPLFIRRSAKATVYEEEAAEYFVNFYQDRYPNRMMPLKVVTTEVPPLDFKQYNPREVDRKKGHPMRNVVLQSLGVQYGQSLRAEVAPDLTTILTATVGDDTFPHSSLTALRAATIATCIDLGNWNWNITSPLIDTGFPNRPFFKKDLILYAAQAAIPLEKTRTCIEGGADPDGTCGECRCRIKAFDQANLKDPINYPSNS